jgi:hypothetical protein
MGNENGSTYLWNGRDTQNREPGEKDKERG